MVKLTASKVKWTRGDLNPRPLQCECSALPLSYWPIFKEFYHFSNKNAILRWLYYWRKLIAFLNRTSKSKSTVLPIP